MRTSRLGRKHKRLRWLSLSYSSVLTTKLDGVQDNRDAWERMRPCKVGRLLGDRKSYTKLIEIRMEKMKEVKRPAL
ncbi:hypothetical protein B296_00053616 [Ensete ventricosum]|uniref:Uncharacterized protein n=1 Tax=Ensete ventricosum TaxID=4639 RepID=A0A426XBG3_ENSVE|nr:hypothetical protein B296_00053616 [Ensete ventricosum]